MPHQDQSVSGQAQRSALQGPAAMQVLKAEDLRAVVGGPEIKNGGEGLVVTLPTPASNG